MAVGVGFWVRVVAVFGVGVLLAGCADDAGSGSGFDMDNLPDTAITSVSGVKVSPEAMVYLVDGELTMAEVDDAYAKVQVCFDEIIASEPEKYAAINEITVNREEGDGPQQRANAGYTFGLQRDLLRPEDRGPDGGSSEAFDNELTGKMQDCMFKYAPMFGQLYDYLNPFTTAEREAQLDEYKKCLAGYGIDASRVKLKDNPLEITRQVLYEVLGYTEEELDQGLGGQDTWDESECSDKRPGDVWATEDILY